ncbi:triose-phosphate isomerase [Mesorhizobium xinjiangense]|uniref:triose-phosphate isomerase n=1 Tax=Mesorhizobium xinjiangense TaxID=2678685 RepID=UPI0012EE3F19|nr:triose-phosphate isomerase [Mesorhizobium xinjiangense]
MTKRNRPLVAGNWKMNGTAASLDMLGAIGKAFAEGLDKQAEALICVPATLVHRAHAAVSGLPVGIGGQDCHAAASGAHTGDISAEMLKDAGAAHVIVGHSERRTDHGETDETVAAKAEAAWRGGLIAIICVGETREEREAGRALDVLSRQIVGSVPAAANAQNTVVAYEPVWAIGTGLTPTLDDVADAHAHIRAELTRRIGQEAEAMRILYGGSVKPSNAGELLALDDVDGGLIGGASLKADDFIAIAESLTVR